MNSLKKGARQYYRRMFGVNNRLDLAIAKYRFPTVVKTDHGHCVERRTATSTVIKSKNSDEPRRGIFLYGACDMATMFEMVPMIVPSARGTLGMLSRSHITFTRPDIVLQSLRDDLPRNVCDRTIARLRLGANYFDPELFQPTFRIPEGGTEPFEKDVIVLSMAAGVTRTIYRHREHGILVDPGGWWLGDPLNTVRHDRETLEWFQREFVMCGRMTPAAWAASFEQLVTEIRSRMDAQILVFNTLTVEPRDPTHNYSQRRHPEGVRRRRFLLALAQLSRDLGVHVIDTDRALKGYGIEGQLDFGHYPSAREPVAEEAYRVLRKLGVVASDEHRVR